MTIGSTSPLLKITGLSVSRGERRVIQSLNLAVNRGDRIIIRGANGCGKTTLLKAITQLLPFQEGEVAYGGKSIGWVPQEGVLNRFPIATEEVVMIGMAGQRVPRREKRERVDQAMKLTGCDHLRRRCFHHLSGGEKQRVSLARCLCQRAELLLLDEPASYLDRENRENLDSLLQNVQRKTGAAILLVTHEQGLFDREKWKTLFMEEGALLKKKPSPGGEL